MYTAEMFIFVILMNELIVTAYIAKAFREERQELGKSGENVPEGRQNIYRLLCSQEKNIAYFADGGDSNVASLLGTEKEGVNLTNEL